MIEKSKKKNLITNFNQNLEKVRKLDQRTLNEMRTSLENYKKLSYGNKFRVPFKLVKIVIAAGLCINLYGLTMLRKARALIAYRNQMEKIHQRKIISFLQCVEDKEYLAMKQREKMIQEAILSSEDKKKLQNRFYHEEEYIPDSLSNIMTHQGIMKNYGSISSQYKDRLIFGRMNSSI